MLSWALIEVLIVHSLIGFLLRLLDKDLIGVGAVVGVGKRRGGGEGELGKGEGTFFSFGHLPFTPYTGMLNQLYSGSFASSIRRAISNGNFSGAVGSATSRGKYVHK